MAAMPMASMARRRLRPRFPSSSETTAATLGKTGVRTFQPMSNLDFVALPLGRYIQNHLDFVAELETPPAIFAVNYFLKDADGDYITGMHDKRVWMKWAELSIHGDVDTLRTPVGFTPIHDDLKKLFKDLLNKEYSREDYVEQFSLGVPQYLAKLDRIEKIWRDVADTPRTLLDVLASQRQRLEEARAEHGDRISPFMFATG